MSQCGYFKEARYQRMLPSDIPLRIIQISGTADSSTMRFLLTTSCLVTVFFMANADDELMPSESREKRDTATDQDFPKHLKIVTIPTQPYTWFDNDEYYGFIPDLIDALAHEVGFTYTFQLSRDGRYGFCREEGNLTNCVGMIDELLKNKTDLIAAPLTVTKEREKYINYVRAFQTIGLAVVVKKQESKEDLLPFNFDIFNPLTWQVYLFVTLFTVAVSLLLWLMNRFNPYEWGGRHDMGLSDKAAAESFNLPSSLWFAFTTLQWQGYERAPRSLASKTLTVFWFVFVTVTLVTYTASLVNHLYWASTIHAKYTKDFPYRNLEDLVKDGKYNYGTVRGGSTQNLLVNLAKGEMYDQMRALWRGPKNKGDKLFVSSKSEGFDKARKEKYAFICESNMAHYAINQRPCDLMILGDLLHPKSYAMGVSHDFKQAWLDKLHIAIMELQEAGEIERLQKKWWVSKGECWNVTKAEETVEAMKYYTMVNRPKRVDLQEFGGPLVLMAVGIVISLIVATAEILFYKYHGRYSPSNRPGGQQLTNAMDDDGRI